MPGVRSSVLRGEIRIEREGIVLGWAPLASIVLHLLAIALILGLVEIAPRRPLPARQPQIAVTFQPIEGLKGPDGSHPPSGGRAGGPTRATPRPPASAAVPAPQPATPSPAERSHARVDPAVPSRSEPAAREENRAAASSLPERDSEAAPEPERPPAERFSVQRALRDFRRSVGAGALGGASGSGGSGNGSGSGLSVPDLPPLPESGFGFGNLQFESRDFDWTEYARQIYVAIWRAWHNRLFLTTDAFEKWGYQNRASFLDHQSGIRFTIERNGQVTGVEVEAASACAPLDDSAVRALEEVVLPPLPDAFPRERETIHARFIAQGDIRAMRPTLSYLRAHGFF